MFYTAETQLPVLMSDPAVGRVQAALAAVTPEQARVGIRAVAQAMRDFLPSDVLLSLAQRLTGEIRHAMLDAATNTPRRMSGEGADASLVMQVAGALPRGFPAHACAVVRFVLAEVASQAGPDGVRAIVAQMPDRLRKLWPAPVWKQKDVAHAA